MRSEHERSLDEPEAEDVARATRRDLLVGTLKLGGGSALALAIIGAPGLSRAVAAQDTTPEAGDDGAEAGDATAEDGGDGAEAGTDDGAEAGGDGGDGDETGTGGGGRDGGDRQDGRGGQADSMPSVGTGSGSQPGSSGVAGLAGLMAAGAAAAAMLTRRRSGSEERSEA